MSESFTYNYSAERQNEIETIRKTMAEDAFESYLEERNDELRNLGIKPIVDNRD